MKRTGSTTSIVIATIAGLSVLGVAGYRMMSGDCQTCPITGNEVDATTVATEGDACCALMEGANKESHATLVSTGEAAGDSCCSEEKAAHSCESGCEDEAAEVEMISTTSEHADECAGDACGKDADECGECEAGKELAKAPE